MALYDIVNKAQCSFMLNNIFHNIFLAHIVPNLILAYLISDNIAINTSVRLICGRIAVCQKVCDSTDIFNAYFVFSVKSIYGSV